jgi:tetratricopeptide (TPR) repeat protein
MPPSSSRGGPTVEAALVTVLLFAIYAAGACPTIYVGDSGELVAAVHTLGIPHPTGYPLYVLLGKLWTLLIPYGSIAWRMSLFSAACAGLACGLLYRLVRRFGLGWEAGTLAALLLAFSPSFWGEANVQRVYALNAVFVAGATSAAYTWRRARAPRALVLAVFLCGLGATNHTFMGIYALLLGAYTLAVDPGLLRRPRLLAQVAAAGVIGLLPYLYLPLRSLQDPRLDWGNPETLSAFLDVVLRRDFWQRAWIEQPADVLVIAADYLEAVLVETAWGGATLAVIGVVAGVRRGWPVGLPLLVMAGNLAALTLHGSRSDIFIWHRYYIPSYVMVALLAAMGCHALFARAPRALRLLPLALPALLLVTGWRAFDRSRYRIADDFSSMVLRSLPPGAHLIATDDNVLFVLIYLQLVEQRRPDVNLILQGVGDADLPPLRFNPDTDPVYFTHHPNWNIPGLEIVPLGVVLRAWRAGTPPPPPAIERWQLDGEHDPRVPKDYLTQNLIGHFHYMIGFTLEGSDWPRARAQYERAAAASPDNDVLFYNLGLIYSRNGLYDDAVAAFRRSQEINPRHLANEKKPRAGEKLEQVVAERERVSRVEAALAQDATLRATAPGSSAYHIRMAELLEAKGEAIAARGHRLGAEVTSDK